MFGRRGAAAFDPAGDDGRGDDEDDDGQRDPGGHFEDVVQAELQANPHQDQGEANFEVDEAVHEVGEQEVHGAEAEQGERVCGEHEEGL